MPKESLLNVSVVGVFAGDEGKGKIVDFLAKDVDFVVRCEGGANAGHTIQFGDKKFIGHLLPCGVLAGKICIIGRGVRLDFNQFLQEIKEIGVQPQIYIDSGAFLSLSWHRAIEWWAEHIKGKSSSRTGTTMRGIGAIAATAALRVNVQAKMIFSANKLRRQLQDFYNIFEPIFENSEFLSGFGPVDPPEKIAEELTGYQNLLVPYLRDTQAMLYQAWKKDKRLLFEGAQGLMLDPYWGTYGYNTTGLCTFAGLAVGSGLPVNALGKRIGVSKLIATRVGNGPFASELGDSKLLEKEQRIPVQLRESFLKELRHKINLGLAGDQEIGQYFRVLANEYGATTNRPRRIGWFDCAWLRYFVLVNDPHEIALTKLDCLSGLKQIKIVTGYRYQHQDAPQPNISCEYEDLLPIYSIMNGWEEDITGETKYENLPINAKKYLEFIENFCCCRIKFIGTGPKREHLIIR